MARRAAKIDGNHRAIVEALEAAGCSVQSLAEVGDGCVDLLCGVAGRNFLLEVKAIDGRLTPQQKKWHAAWHGKAHVVHTVDQALVVAKHYRLNMTA